MKINGVATFRAGADRQPYSVDRRELRANDVDMASLAAGA